MADEWHKLTKLTGGAPLIVERVRLRDSGIAIEGEFELPRLSQISSGDQVFVAAFVRCHGSIKQMEKFFGVSYPTIKSRLARLSEQLDFVEITSEVQPAEDDVLSQLEQGAITVDQAVQKLKEKRT
jgi:hypothetical protein